MCTIVSFFDSILFSPGTSEFSCICLFLVNTVTWVSTVWLDQFLPSHRRTFSYCEHYHIPQCFFHIIFFIITLIAHFLFPRQSAVRHTSNRLRFSTYPSLVHLPPQQQPPWQHSPVACWCQLRISFPRYQPHPHIFRQFLHMPAAKFCSRSINVESTRSCRNGKFAIVEITARLAPSHRISCTVSVCQRAVWVVPDLHWFIYRNLPSFARSCVLCPNLLQGRVKNCAKKTIWGPPRPRPPWSQRTTWIFFPNSRSSVAMLQGASHYFPLWMGVHVSLVVGTGWYPIHLCQPSR